jgi:predicted nucleic acid-binding protein
MPIVYAKDLASFLSEAPDRKSGCLIDTNILFAANFSLDHLHEESVEIFKILMKEKVPLFTNVNIRSEFINLARKVVIVHALLDLLHDLGANLLLEVYNKLRSLKTRSDGKESVNSLLKMSDDEIEQLRNLLAKYHPTSTQDLWDWFCEDYFKGKIAAEWMWVERDFGIEFLTLRYAEDSAHLENELHWTDAVSIIERTGIGSADAMIVNLLFQSRYHFLVSADSDMAFAMKKLGPANKFVVVMDKASV